MQAPTQTALKHAQLLMKPVPLSLFPTMDSLEAVVNLATAQLPISHRNQVITLLSVYHNTLLNQLKK